MLFWGFLIIIIVNMAQNPILIIKAHMVLELVLLLWFEGGLRQSEGPQIPGLVFQGLGFHGFMV